MDQDVRHEQHPISLNVEMLTLHDVDELQKLVTRASDPAPGWTVEYCQTQAGCFAGLYQGAYLPGFQPNFGEQSAATCYTTVAGPAQSSTTNGFWLGHHRYGRGLQMHGTTPADWGSLVTSAGHDVEIRQKGQSVGLQQLLFTAAGDEVDILAPAGTDALSIMIGPTKWKDICCGITGLGEDVGSGVLSAQAATLAHLRKMALDVLGSQPSSLLNRVTPLALSIQMENTLVVLLDHADVEAVGRGFHRLQRIARMVRDYLHHTTDRPVSILELCAEANVSARTLQRGFARYFGVSPIRYHKMYRLNLARDALRALKPAEASVTRVAEDSGFDHLGRFALEYKSAFGESPSQTLRTRP